MLWRGLGRCSRMMVLAPAKEETLCWLIGDEEVDAGHDIVASAMARSGFTRRVTVRAL